MAVKKQEKRKAYPLVGSLVFQSLILSGGLTELNLLN